MDQIHTASGVISDDLGFFMSLRLPNTFTYSKAEISLCPSAIDIYVSMSNRHTYISIADIVD